ncbi:uncharacterized protein DNG_01665 [Cephalotrichum gorgonifer]|uniref:Uncharacterized protein n=1 Tax=Cephalotrichum gorgonifer TaxID=2041049 RepID=A0AAE8MS50_9PEZI|nr:uncharacterized protein DNG_01665 [Cephalotrichum gorgonifer]
MTMTISKEQVTSNPPAKEAPMVAGAGAGASPAGVPGAVISQQPTSEPKPEMSRLRGGGMSMGFDCCGGSCRFYKHCC